MKKKDSDFNDLLYRLKAADPAKRAVSKIGEHTLMNATKGKPKSSKWGFPQFATLSGLATASVATLIVGLSLPAAVTAGPEPLLSLGAQSSASLDGRAAAGEADTAQDKSMLWYQPYEYIYKPGALLSKEPSKGNAYKFTLTGDGSKELDSLIEWFDIEGNVTIDPYNYDKTHFFIGDIENYDTQSLSLYWSNLGSWYFSNPEANQSIDSSCGLDIEPRTAEASTDDSISNEGSTGSGEPMNISEESDLYITPVEPCFEQIPPTDLPTKEDAKNTAYELFSTMGLGLDANDIVVNSDEWSVTANYSLVIDGEKTNVIYDIAWYGPEVAYASGSFAKPELIQEVDMISAYDAVNRIEDYRWWGSYYQDVMGYAIAYSTSADDSTNSDDSITTLEIPAPLDGEPGDSGDISPEEWLEPAMETVEVVFDSAEQKLLMVWDASGNVWMLPGYVYKTSNDKYYGSPAVVAVEASLINLPKE
jgi:hypothetical protein